MATPKPSKPGVNLPENFGGIKTPYSDAQIRDGYQDGVPEIVDGGNINYEKDALFQKLKYLETIADAINGIPVGKFLVVNSNNQFEYADASAKSSFGNIGDIQYTVSTEVPLGGAWCDGALYTKAQFPDIYQMLVDGKIQSTTVTDFDSKVSANGSCGFFALDTSNERFKVPLLKDVYVKAGLTPSMFGAESLPNIKGSFGGVNGALDPTGAFYTDTTKNNAYHPATPASDVNYLGLNASRSSSTYQDGAKVNPDHVTYRAYVVLYASAAEASVAQAAEFMTALGGKANVDMDNLSSAGQSLISGLGMPGARYIWSIFNNTVTNTKQNFTAPANGYIKIASAANVDVDLLISGDYKATCGNNNGANRGLMFPIKKGEIAQIYSIVAGATAIMESSAFIYAEGEKQ